VYGWYQRRHDQPGGGIRDVIRGADALYLPCDRTNQRHNLRLILVPLVAGISMFVVTWSSP
jgi:hypothetical protein